MKNTFIFMDYQNQPVDPELIVEKIEENGKVVGGKAYGHWSKYPATMFSFSRHGIELIEMPEDGFGNKKGNDIKLAVDAMETMFSLTHIENFVLVTGDADFVPLVKKLRTYGKSVTVISRSQNTSSDMQLSADYYIPYEEIVKSEKITSTDSFEDVVEEIMKIIDEKSLNPDEVIVRRIITGMNINYSNFGYKSLNSFTEAVINSVKKNIILENNELSEYEENYMRFLERLTVQTFPPLNAEQLEEMANSRHQWIIKNTKIPLKKFIENIVMTGKLKTGPNETLYVPAPRRWEIKHEKILPYPEYRDKFSKYVFDIFTEKKVSTISDALHKAKDDINLSNKIIGSFGMALKFSGMFRGKDGSDYVSLKTPVTLIGSYEEFKTSIDNFYLKRILKEENIDQDNLKYASVYLFNTENTEEIVKCLNYLVTKKEVYRKENTFQYYK